MSLDNISSNEKQKVKDYLDSYVKVMQEVADLKDGLKDVTKNLAEELDIKPAILNRAGKQAYKSTLDEEREEMEMVEALLRATGRLSV
jgi:hypothetical protein